MQTLNLSSSHEGVAVLRPNTTPELFVGQWWLDVFDEMDGAVDAEQLFQSIARVAGDLGFRFCSYGVRFPLYAMQGQTTVRVFESYPNGWMDHYFARNYAAVDPTVIHGARTSMPLVWSDQLFAGARNLWDDARDHGLNCGIAQSSWTAFGVFGLLSFARSNEPISDAELKSLTPRMRWLAESAHSKMHTLLSDRHLSGASIALSAREAEVLRWTADGKTAWEISRILGISESTVAFHLRNATSKLGCQNKVQAVARAMALGLLFQINVQKHETSQYRIERSRPVSAETVAIAAHSGVSQP